MTKEQWQEVEKSLMHLYEPVKLICDGYNLTLRLTRNKMQLVIAFYVNGRMTPEWMDQDCEERRRFFRPAKHSVWTASQKAQIAKMSKKQLKRLNIDPGKHVVFHYPWWTSFKSLKAHLVKFNTSIELAPETK